MQLASTCSSRASFAARLQVAKLFKHNISYSRTLREQEMPEHVPLSSMKARVSLQTPLFTTTLVLTRMKADWTQHSSLVCEGVLLISGASCEDAGWSKVNG